MNSVASVIKMHVKDKWTWFIIPWMVLLSSFIVNIVISLLTDAPIYSGGIASIYIYMFVSGIIVMAQTFPFALGMSVRRTDYFLGTSAMIILTSAGSALLLFLLGLTESWTDAWGSGLHFFQLPYLTEGPLINQFLFAFGILLFMYYSGVVISALHKCTGRNGLFIASGILLIVVTVLGFLASYLDWYSAIFKWIIEQSAMEYTLWTLPFTFIFAAAAYLLLRRATV